MAKSFSPLRYPGGKTKIYDKVKNLIIVNGYGDRMYVEPFAGGFGIGIGLLHEGVIKQVILNDFDTHIYNFWFSVLNDTDNLLRLISDTPITLREREEQRRNYRDTDSGQLLDGFSTLFLNRVNFSGIIKGGPVGGASQAGKYKMDCRFNKDEIIRKIEMIAQFNGKIKLYNSDAGRLIKMNLLKIKKPMFLNIDPPYVVKGSQLYTNYFKEQDHRNLQQVIVSNLNEKIPWIITYDDCLLVRNLYSGFFMKEYDIVHNAGGSVRGKEIVITNLHSDSFFW